MKLKAKNNPKILYHYTSVETLLKILDNSVDNKICFRATHAKFFNDPYEYKLAVLFLKQSIVKYEKENNIKNGQSSIFNKNSLERLGVASGDPFMLSLSENSDDLTMWRTYGADGKGITIGIDREMLDNYSNDKKNTNTILLPCQYDKTKIINRLTKDWYFLYNKVKFMDGGKKLSMKSLMFIFNLVAFSFSFKRNEYSLEKEWRLCKNEFDETKVKYREKNGLVIPFIEHYFEKEIIKKIIIGPCVNKKLTKESIEMLLKSRKYNLPQSSITISRVPYRQI